MDNEHIMQFFAFEHLPPHLREVSESYARMATALVTNLPRNPDAAVRARLAGDAELNAKVSLTAAG